jgi:quercetin dioxygenase-like cupin family protein
MDLESLKKAIVTNVYHIDSSKKIALHKHNTMDEIFYCVAGSGYGVLENSETALSVGEAFIVKAGEMHSLRTDDYLIVASFLVPNLREEN